MAIPIYSVNLGLGSLPQGWWDWLVPQTGETLVLRDLELVNSSSTPCEVILLILNPSTGLAAYWFKRTLQPNEWFQWQGRLVVQPDNKLQSFAQNASAVFFTSSGYRLTPAPTPS